MGAFGDFVNGTLYPMIRDASLTLASIAIMVWAMRAIIGIEGRGEAIRGVLRSLLLLATVLVAPLLVDIAGWIAG